MEEYPPMLSCDSKLGLGISKVENPGGSAPCHPFAKSIYLLINSPYAEYLEEARNFAPCAA
jgi:hypothetical protein